MFIHLSINAKIGAPSWGLVFPSQLMRPGTGRPPYCLNWEDTKRIADIVFNNLAHEMPHNSHAETGQPPYVSILLQTSPLIILNYIETGNSSQARVVLRCWGFPGPDWAWWIIVHSREAHSFYYFHPKETTFYFSISISLYIGHFHKFVFPLLGRVGAAGGSAAPMYWIIQQAARQTK